MTETAKGKASPLLQAAIVIIAIAALVSLLVLPELVQKTPPQTHQLHSAPGCDLTSSSCVATAGTEENSQQISLSIKSEQIKSAVPLLFEVSLGSSKADQVMLDLKGKDMYMGINQVMLNPVPGSDNIWQGEVTLAVCTTGEMTWITSVITEANGQITQADFEFKAH
ncbi:hypothetical protein [Neptuniibacter sp.]|uniref:hypothetical protein n=1 Tax=Neptuniibacter sp. TaxID=1962643 RepID=UPI002632ED28|nr:hypothetical protein [Neptuniibacter sp.]MCP4596260.1 hypothetical protein [Neptuniibacter sp.]